MQRNTQLLANETFDLIVIGGGAFGAAAAHDATLRGLKTALIERNDFGAGASAECFKMVHGGIRYLQHADVRRLRHSCHERSALLHIAPHLVQPLSIAIPTYGHGRSGKLLLGTGARVYDLLTLDRNRHIGDPLRRIHATKMLSRSELLRWSPHLQAPHLTGAVVFQDGQMHNPARLVLAFVKSAVANGAVACNYLEATHFLWEGRRVCGIRAVDRLSGEEIDVRARLVLNAAGPWAEYLFADRERFGPWQRRPYSRDAYFIVNRAPTSHYALAVQGLSTDKDARFGRSARHLFAVPWRNRTLLGVWHRHFTESPDQARVTPDEIARWMQELNVVYPQLQLQPDEVSFANCGLVPFGDVATEGELSFGKESQFIDHRRQGIAGLVTVIGIRFTTARADAAHALDLLVQQWPHSLAVGRTDRTPLIGGNIEDFAAFRRDAESLRPHAMNSAGFDSLLRNFGTEYRDVLATDSTHAALADSDTLVAEVRFAIRHEMAVRLGDIVLRRTDIAAGGHPGVATLQVTAAVMAQEHGWDSQRCADEMAAVETCLARHLAVPSRAKPRDSIGSEIASACV